MYIFNLSSTPVTMCCMISRRLANYKGLVLITLFFLSACQNFISKQSPKEDPKGRLIARAATHQLFESDLEGLVPIGASSEDSTSIVDRYIHSWIRKQLVLEKARSSVEIDEVEIERKLLNYRYDLIAYQFEQEFIRENLDTTVNRATIEQYYQDNQERFQLKENILKARLIEVPAELAEKEQIRSLMQSQNPEDLEKLRELCIKHAIFYYLNDSLWIESEDLLNNKPFQERFADAQTPNPQGFYEAASNENLCFIYIKEFISADNTAPLDYVGNRIKDIIINQRKIRLSRDLEQNVMEQASKENAFEIFENL